MGEVLIVGGNSDMESRLKKALGMGADAQFRHTANLGSLQHELSQKSCPHVIVMTAPNDLPGKTCRQLLSNIREFDRACCVLMLSDTPPSAQAMMAWLDCGATGLLHKDFLPEQVSEVLLEALLRRLNVHKARDGRVPARHKVTIKLASLEQAVVSETLNVGVGGMFVRTLPPDVKVGDSIDFELQLSSQEVGSHSVDGIETNTLIRRMDEAPHALANGKSNTLHGNGRVVWIRMESGHLPEGMGVQFAELDSSAQDLLERFLAQRRVQAFIPIS